MTLKLSATDARALSLVKAIHEGDVESLRGQLLAESALAQARIIDDKGVGRTLLHIVADWPGHFPNGAATVAVLATAGAELDAALWHTPTAGAPETALHWAASNDDAAVLDALLDAGADIEAPGAIFTGGPAMSDAVVFAQWRAARRLLERGAKTTLWQAAALGLVTRVGEHLVAASALPREQMTNALWHACRGGQLAVAEILLDQDADLNWVGYDGKAPLDVARESGVKPLIDWLEARGAVSARSS